MSPGTLRTIESVKNDADYEFVTAQFVQIYPGSGSEHIYRHKLTGILWAALVCSSDDDSDYDDSKRWYEVEPLNIVRYVAVDVRHVARRK